MPFGRGQATGVPQRLAIPVRRAALVDGEYGDDESTEVDIPPGLHTTEHATMPTMSTTTVNRLLWAAQILTAVIFAFAGIMKFIMPAKKMQQGPIVFPMAFLYFIAACECLGALGLVLPGLFRVRTMLTPLAAAGLTIIMIGATVVSIMGMGIAMGIFPGVVGIVTAWIAYGRTRIAPLRDSRDPVLHTA